MEWKAFLQAEHIPFEENISLKKKTWIHRGGKAHYYITPDSLDQLIHVVTRLYQERLPFKIVGHTSNLYIRDTTDIEFVISTIHLNHFEEKNGQYICECGVAIADLSRKAIESGHAGYEGFVNLPGTIASAAVNNAGCFGCCISDMLTEAIVLCPDGKHRTVTKEMFNYSERSSAFKRGDFKGVVLQVILDCKRMESKDVLLVRAQSNMLYRKTRQEGPKQNLGSTYPIYVMDAFYKNLPFRTRVCLMLSAKWYHLIRRQRSQAIINALILLSNGKYVKLHRYISKFNFGCFVWRDEKADEAFVIYRSFVAKIADLPDIEIEVL